MRATVLRFLVPRRVAVLISSVLALSFLQAPSASASASGCTWAPGGAAAQQCINVQGAGLYVSSVANQYFPSPWSGYAANVCNRSHQNKFTNPNGSIGYWEANPSSCIPGAVAVFGGDYVVWHPNRTFYNGRGMCARSNNSVTGGWTPFACITVWK